MGGPPATWDGERPRERTKARRAENGTIRFVAETGYPFYLQNHGNPVRYRNI